MLGEILVPYDPQQFHQSAPVGASVPREVGDGRDGAPRAAVQLEGGVGGRQSALDKELGFMFLDVLIVLYMYLYMYGRCYLV